MALPVFKTGLAANIVAGGFDSLPPPPVAPVLSRSDSVVSRFLVVHSLVELCSSVDELTRKEKAP